MPKRSKRSQSKHDAEVEKTARRLERQGYDVQADLAGFRQPDTIAGYRPEVVARKGRERKIVEVETPESVDSARDRGQQRAFREAAKRSKNTTFIRRITQN